jgi:hypothetical protein
MNEKVVEVPVTSVGVPTTVVSDEQVPLVPL